MREPRAPYVQLYGGEGAGKTTGLEQLKRSDALEPTPTHFLKEPGGEYETDPIRALVLSDLDVHPSAKALLLFAEKVHKAARIIGPFRDRGTAVVSDRGMFDTFIYNLQAEGLEADEPLFWQLADRYLEVPSMAVLLDVNAETGLARRAGAGGGNVYEARGLEYHRRINELYRILWRDAAGVWFNRSHLRGHPGFESMVRKLADCRFVRIDANPEPGTVYRDIEQLVHGHLQDYRGAHELWQSTHAKEPSRAAER